LQTEYQIIESRSVGPFGHLSCSPDAIELSPPKKGKIPRPRNSWIIFRSVLHTQMMKFEPGLSIQEICKLTQVLLCNLLTATSQENFRSMEQPVSC
jgi:hypothetical protein